jgi:guanylate kinase
MKGRSMNKTVRKMGHLFILCGPPGSGKTSLLKLIHKEKIQLKQIQRITTREFRIEEGDTGKPNLEYEFLSADEFAGRVSRGSVANLIEWAGHYYATETEIIYRTLESGTDCLLYEDIPSSLVLKRQFGSNATTMLLFTDDQEEFLRLEFGSISSSNRASILEWKRRLALKYAASLKSAGILENDRDEYIQGKMKRAIPDMAFIAGKMRIGEDIRVLANKKDKQKETIKSFVDIVNSVTQNTVIKDNPGNFAFVLMPFRDEFNKLYRFVIKPAVESEGLSCLRGDEIFTRLNVVEDILSHIEACSLIISDITGGNPNVFLELGVSMKLDKPIILLSQDSESPFDVRTCRWINHENTLDGWEFLSNQLIDHLRKIKRRKDSSLNPPVL